MKRPLLLLALTASLSLPAGAAQLAGTPRQVPTVTRLVQLFGTLENELMAAVQKGDTATIDTMLADDFELRNSAMPGAPIPRAEWLKHSHGQITGSIEQVAVHDYDVAAIVSYLWKQGVRHDIFVVDVWRKSGDAWKLSVRYASPAGDRRFTLPGTAPNHSTLEKK